MSVSGTLQLSGATLIGEGTVTDAGHLTTSTSNNSTALSSITMASGSSLTVGGGLEAKFGASVVIGDNANVLISNAQSIAVDGGATMTVGATTVVLDDYNNGGYGITVAGTLTATNSSFSPTRSAFGTGSGISIYASGQIHATNTYFGWDAFRLYDGNSLAAGDLANDTFQTIVYAPGTDIPLLAGPTLTANKSFQDIDINAGSLNTGTLTLGLMGSASTAKLRYVFPSGYEVKSGATLAIADNVNVLINNAQTIAVDGGGAMTVGATTVVLDDYNNGGYGITVAGTLTATNSSFSPTRSAFGTGSGISIYASGQIHATNTYFGWDAFRLYDGTFSLPETSPTTPSRRSSTLQAPTYRCSPDRHSQPTRASRTSTSTPAASIQEHSPWD